MNNAIQYVYGLLDKYLANKINAKTFCDEFYYSYDKAIDRNKLTSLEIQVFDDLSVVAGRFSEFEEDHKNCPKAFFTEEELKQKIIKTKKLLMN